MDKEVYSHRILNITKHNVKNSLVLLLSEHIVKFESSGY